MVWVISLHRLRAWHLDHSLNASQKHLLLLPPGSFGSFCFVRVPASLGPSIRFLWFCFSVLASLLPFCIVSLPASLVPPLIVCFCALLSLLLWDKILFCQGPGLSGSHQPLCAFGLLSWLLWDSFCVIRVPHSLVPSPLIVCFVCFCALLSQLLWDNLCGS